MNLLRLLLVCLSAGLAACSSPKSSADFYHGPPPVFADGKVYAPRKAPAAVHRAMAAANAIQHVPYQYGGGHGRTASRGLDCSGSVSYVLREAGLMRGCLTSDTFRKFGKSGGGHWITVFANDGHVFMTICGLRLDTSSRGTGVGPRFSQKPRSVRDFKVRHPAGY